MNFIRNILLKKYTILVVFATSMGFLEAIVVVYVRELYYPQGFDFPLVPLPSWLVGIEVIRELCTLLMLGSVAWISGKVFLQRLSVFLFLFGVWDIFYYIALKIFLDWPASLLTWDILFLIPITWIGPVLAPVICSLVMIGMAFLFEQFYFYGKINNLKFRELLLMIVGAGVIFFTFTYDFGTIVWKGDFLKSLSTLPENPEFLKIMSTFVPEHFLWWMFASGMLLIFAGTGLVVRRAVKEDVSL